MHQDGTIRILLVDKHLLTLTGLRLILESQHYMRIVGEASDKISARTLTAVKRPDIILLEIDLGEDDGFTLLAELLEILPETRVILVTGVRNPEIHRHAIMLGAVGVVLKDKDCDTLIKAIEKVYAGELWLDRSMIADMLNIKRRDHTVQEHDPKPVKHGILTIRERDVIRLVGMGLKNKQVANQLVISEATVRHHLTSIFAKLSVADRFELAVYAYKNGLAPVPR